MMKTIKVLSNMLKNLLIIGILLIMVSLAFAQSYSPPDVITEEDGSPTCYVPWQKKYTNGSVTCNADGTASIDFAAGIGGAFTAGSVLFSDGTTIAEDNANLFWDNSNNRLGIETNTPSESLEVAGLAQFSVGLVVDDAVGAPKIIGGTPAASTSRLMIQPESGDRALYFFALPSGTNTIAEFQMSNSSDRDNRGRLRMTLNGATAGILTDLLGSGTTPTTFNIGEANIASPALTNINFQFDGVTKVTIEADGTTNFNDNSLANVDNIALNTISDDAGVENTLSIANLNTAYDHSINNTQAHSDYLLNNASDTTSGVLTAAGFDLGDNAKLRLGASQDAVIDYDSANNSLDINLTGGVDASLRVLTDNGGSFEVDKAGLINQVVSDYSSGAGVSYYYGGLFEITRSGSQSPTNQLAMGWRFVFNEEANTATRGVNNFNISTNYTGDGGGSLYGLSNIGSGITDNSANTGSLSAITVGNFQFTLRNSGATTVTGDTVALKTNIGSGGPFVGSHTTTNMFGLSMSASFGNGAGTLTVNDTFAHLSATEIGIQPNQVNPALTIDFNTATNIYVERMLYGTSKSAFHMATSGSADGAQMLFAKQGSASIYYDGDFVFDPAITTAAVSTAVINNGGTGYIVDGIHTIDGGGGGSTARIQITSVSSGVVTGLQIIDVGKDYTAGNGYATSEETVYMGGNDDLTVDITVNTDPSLRVLGSVKIPLDNKALTLGAGQERKIYSDGTNLIIDPNVVGSGKVLIGATGDDDLDAATITAATAFLGPNVTSGNDPGHTHSASAGADTTAIHDNVAAEISVITEKASPATGDWLIIEDAADSNNKKRVNWSSLPGASGGEANTASSAGTGTSLYYQKTAVDLEFNAIKSENNRLSVALDAITHDIELTVNEANIDHDALTNFLAAEHIDWTGAAAGTIHTDNYIEGGAGTDTTAIHDNVASEISILTEKVTPVNADMIIIEDSADSNNKKMVQVGNLPGGGGTDRVLLTAFRNTSMTASNYIYIDGTTSMSATIGFPIVRAGSITGISINSRSNSDSAVVRAHVYVNGVSVFYKEITTGASETNVQYTVADTQAAGIDNVSAGDLVQMYLQEVSGVMDFEAITIIVEITND